MPVGVQSRCIGRNRVQLTILAVGLVAWLTAAPVAAQVNGIPPSVTSLQYHLPPFLPNVPPSVTSVGPYGYSYGHSYPYVPHSGLYSGHHGYGHGSSNENGSGAWIVPYYVPMFGDPSGGYDPGTGGSGPYLYSGPPQDDPPDHVVVDMLPDRRGPPPAEDDDTAQSMPTQSSSASYALPVDSTVLVFRDGHQQKVTNYAIMGQTVYVFDSRTQKIGLGDLDVPATIKLNDDRGVEFQLPKAKQS
jgi:hypothetical protein